MKKILIYGLFLCLGMTLKAQYGGEMTIGARLNYTGGGKLVTYDGKIVNLGYTIKGIVSGIARHMTITDKLRLINKLIFS